MSFDLAVWYPAKNLTNEEAREVYIQLCEGEIDAVRPHEAIDRFYSAVTSMHPEIDEVADEDIDDLDVCPWSNAFDRSPGHLILSCVWSKAEYVEELIVKLAREYGLAVYNPQTGEYVRPHTE
ncbi:hypothetical protein CDO73_12155 [Saccharibacillus sp. O23]|uniref:hypothetical protein n=1 Tax=Saccharibacillus sp. O23 TaxID=2009338 RepID=UPI000B4E73EC|nr:hypothetical protein [Saccharibacillus sp. O23]OWR29833.1 hypothetical protein CDO73_12155 [Saccharibacillus sp. O23]